MQADIIRLLFVNTTPEHFRLFPEGKSRYVTADVIEAVMLELKRFFDDDLEILGFLNGCESNVRVEVRLILKL